MKLYGFLAAAIVLLASPALADGYQCPLNCPPKARAKPVHRPAPPRPQARRVQPTPLAGGPYTPYVSPPEASYQPRYVEHPVEIPVDRPSYVERPVQVTVDRPEYVERRVEVPVDRPEYVERRVEVPVDKPVYVPVPRQVEVDVPVYVERRVEIPVDRPVYVDRPVEVPVDRPVYVDRPRTVYVDRPIYAERSNYSERAAYADRRYEAQAYDCRCATGRDYRYDGYSTDYRGHVVYDENYLNWARSSSSYRSSASSSYSSSVKVSSGGSCVAGCGY